VRTADGEFIAADVVVLNPDLPIAYRDLLPVTPARIGRLRPSPSAVVLHLGSTNHYDRIAHHNLHFGHAWQRTFDEVIRDGRLMSDPSLFVSNPTRSEPSLAPPGREGQLFGLYATTGRAVSFLAPTLFGVAITVFGAQRAGIAGILVVLAAGLVALAPVRAPGNAHPSRV